MSLELKKLLSIDNNIYIRILRLLDLIKGVNKTIESMEEPHTASIVKQYFYQKKQFVEELEELLKKHDIVLEYDSILPTINRKVVNKPIKVNVQGQRLLEQIDNANELIASAQKNDNPLMIEQYRFMKKELVEELEQLMDKYQIQLTIDKAA